MHSFDENSAGARHLKLLAPGRAEVHTRNVYSLLLENCAELSDRKI